MKKDFALKAEEHKEVLQKYCPMPSKREIRKLYVNGQTICIEFFFCLFQILASAGCAAVTERDSLRGLGVIPQQAFWRVENPPKAQTCTCLHCLPNQNG